MPYEKNNDYVNMPFCSETNRNEFYTYYNIQDLALKSETFKYHSFKCRTIGILKSINGCYFIADIKLPINNADETMIRVSMIYLKSPPKSTYIPYTVQIFGTLQWRKQPVIYINILQELNTAMALRLKETFTSVSTHLAQVLLEVNESIEQ